MRKRDSAPLFSIIIPTRKRAHLLRYALQSALEQRFSDYEIIVSNNGSDTETEHVVSEIEDNRIRYFSTDKVLSMPDHWEFALGKAQGRWITVLTDRYVLVPSCLAKVAKVIEESKTQLVCWRWANYYHDSSYERGRANQLWVPLVTGKKANVRSQEALTYFFGFNKQGLQLPAITLSFCHREVIAKAKRKNSRFFYTVALDFYSLVRMLMEVDSYIACDEILTIAGSCKESTSASSRLRGQSGKAFYDEFKSEELLRYVPLKLLLPDNAIGEALLTAKHDFAHELSPYKFNWENYFVGCYQDIYMMESYGVNAWAEKKHYLKVLMRQPLSVILSIGTFLLIRNAVTFAKRIEKGFGFCVLQRYLDSRRARTMAAFRGEDLGCSNILEFARQLDALLEKGR